MATTKKHSKTNSKAFVQPELQALRASIKELKRTGWALARATKGTNTYLRSTPAVRSAVQSMVTAARIIEQNFGCHAEQEV